jgi:hypothetical protein
MLPQKIILTNHWIMLRKEQNPKTIAINGQSLRTTSRTSQRHWHRQSTNNDVFQLHGIAAFSPGYGINYGYLKFPPFCLSIWVLKSLLTQIGCRSCMADRGFIVVGGKIIMSGKQDCPMDPPVPSVRLLCRSDTIVSIGHLCTKNLWNDIVI